MNISLSTLHIDWMLVIGAVAIVIASWFFQLYLLKRLFYSIESLWLRKQRHFLAHVTHSSNEPLRVISFSLFTTYALFLLLGIDRAHTIYLHVVHSLLYIGGSWAMYKLLHFYSLHPAELSLARNTTSESVLLPFFCRFAKFAALGLGGAGICQVWDFNVSGIAAGLGMGSVALALGGKDVLSNMFGGMAIALDKPFSRGDWISTQDREIEGLVEEVNFRSTKLLTFDKAILYIPNTFLANQPIINWTRRDVRKVRFHLFIDSSSPEATLRHAMQEIKVYMDGYAGVEADSAYVFVDDLTESGYAMKVEYFTHSSEYKEAMETKQEVNFAVSRILQTHRIAFTSAHQTLVWNRNR